MVVIVVVERKVDPSGQIQGLLKQPCQQVLVTEPETSVTSLSLWPEWFVEGGPPLLPPLGGKKLA